MKINFYTLMLSLGVSTTLMAQTPEDVDSSYKEVRLNEIILSANRTPEQKRNVAQQTIVLTSRKMEFLNQQTTASLLEQTGSVFVQKSQLGGGSPSIRGFEANKVLLVVDGVRMNNAIFRGGHLQNVISMDNTILERTEILLGPASVIYGSDALGGVISFFTRKPMLSNLPGKNYLNVKAFARHATAYLEKSIHADIMTGSNKIGSLTSFTFSDFGDLRQGKNRSSDYPEWGKRNFYAERINNKDSMVANPEPHIQKQTGYKQYDFIQKLFFTSGKKLEHTLNFQYSNTGNVYRYDRLTETSNGSLKSAEWYYGPARRLLFSYRLEILKANFYDNASITTAFQDIDESRHNRNFGSSRLNHRYENVKVYSLNADFSKKIGKNQLRYGSEFTHNNVQSRAMQENISTHTFTSLDTRYPSGGSNTQSYAIYATHTAHLTDKFVLNDGLRVTHSRLNADFNDKTFFPFPFNDVNQHSTAFTGNLGLIYNPTTNWKISAVLSSGFRAPNVDDLAKVFESANGNLIIPNPNLQPERTLNYELGVTTVISGKVQLGITGYYTRFTNALTTEPSTFNGQDHVLYNGVLSPVSTTVNKTTAYIYGSNASLAADINKNISFTTSYNYTFGRIKESPEYPLDHIPPSFGRTSISFRFSSFTGELFALYNGAKHAKDYNLRGEDNQVYSADPKDGFTPAWITLNLRTQYQFNKHLSLQFGLENITDRFYRVFASGLSSPGRSFVFTLRGRI